MSFTLHPPALRRGILLHMVLSTALLSVAVVLGPPAAWLTGQSTVVMMLAALTVLTRAGVARWHAYSLWRASASPGLVMRTCLVSGAIGYSLVFVPLNLLGMISGGVLQQTGLAALLALVIDAALTLGATAAGALTAAMPSKRRTASRSFGARNIPVVRQVQDAFDENRNRGRLDI